MPSQLLETLMFRIMRSFSMAGLLLLASTVSAETIYVSDEYSVPLRSSPCAGCSILHRGIKSGTPMTLVETNGEGWAHVTTSSGLDGWMPSQYLQKEPVARDLVERMKTQLATAEEKALQLTEELQRLKEENAQSLAELGRVKETNDEVSSELSSIKKMSANAISMNAQNQELLERNGILQNEIDVLKATNHQLESSDRNTWFLYGALAVLMGSMLTLILPRLKRRKRFSEWG
ncbi:TIGR04211 family SH3 domain-containing protein [Porticoccus sp.]|uniref:TIGR04211 family SH3 domain-containing protein n=1 Tax=Porticoccus sp. TaxID=2024853 RepID=UPI003F6A3BCD